MNAPDTCPLVAGRALAVVALASVLAGCFTSEGSGELALKQYPAAGFTSVTLISEGEVTITPGDFAVFVSAEDNILPSVVVAQEGERLILGRDVDPIDGIRATRPIEFRVSMPLLNGVRVSSAGSVAVRGVSGAGALTLAVSGGGVVDAANVASALVAIEVDGAGRVFASGVQAQVLRCDVGGSGSVSIAGEAEDVLLRVGGSGAYRGSDLRSSSADVDVTGAGQALVWAEHRLDARVDGNGSVIYRGEPKPSVFAQRDGQVTAFAEDGRRGVTPASGT